MSPIVSVVVVAGLSAALVARHRLAAPPAYAVAPQWLKLRRPHEIGSMHGDIAVSAAGEIFIRVEGSVRQRFAVLGPSPGLQVYAPDGHFLRNVDLAPSDLHGFVIHRRAVTLAAGRGHGAARRRVQRAGRSVRVRVQPLRTRSQVCCAVK